MATLPPNLTDGDVRRLQLFLKIVECGGFSPAQAVLNISAASISTQMAALESRLGMRLCQRGRVGFRLTDKGRRVHEAAFKLFAAHDVFRSEIGALRGKLVGHLAVAVADNTITNRACRIAAALDRFNDRAQDVHITLHVLEPGAIERGLLDGTLHIGVAAFHHHVKGLSYRALFDEDQALYCSAAHKLFGQAEAVAVEDVLAWPYVARGYMGDHQTPNLPWQKKRATAYDMEAIALLILSGRYVGYLPTHYAARWEADGRMRAIRPDRLGYASTFEVATLRSGARLRVPNAFLEDLTAAHDR